MPRQIITGSGGPSVPVLEHRIAVLERQVGLLTEALRALAAVLEGAPNANPDGTSDGTSDKTLHEGAASAARPEPDLLPLGK